MTMPVGGECPSPSRAWAIADLREDGPVTPPEREGAYVEYAEDLAAVGSGGDPWAAPGSTPRAGADPFGASGAFDDLREPRPADGYGAPGGTPYETEAERRFLRGGPPQPPHRPPRMTSIPPERG